MDITQALRDTENALRDFISDILSKKFGDNWIDNCGVSADRIERWRERKIVEEKRQEAGVVEERLLYYADFYDLKIILKKHWNEFTDALGELKTLEVWLTELERLRDPDAHRRELLPHQKSLAVGISGEIRTRLIRYRSKQETAEGYFPKIESARDSLGNIWTPGGTNTVQTGSILRVGDVIDFVITASDPFGEPLRYSLVSHNRDRLFRDSNVLSWEVMSDQIGRLITVTLFIKSNRDYHAGDYADDWVFFNYTVLPKRLPKQDIN